MFVLFLSILANVGTMTAFLLKYKKLHFVIRDIYIHISLARLRRHIAIGCVVVFFFS